MLVPARFCATAERSLAKLSPSDSLAIESLSEELRFLSNNPLPALTSVGRRSDFVCRRQEWVLPS